MSRLRVFWLIGLLAAELCNPSSCRGDARALVSTVANSWRANKESLPALEAELVIDFYPRASGDGSGRTGDTTRAPAAPTVAIRQDPREQLRYRVARALGRVRIIAQHSTDPADPAADMLFDGDHWTTVERSGEHLVLRRPDQLSGLGPLDPSSLPSSQLCVDFADEIETAAAQADSVSMRSNDDQTSWLVLHFNNDGQATDYYIEFDSKIGMLPTRMWINLGSSTISLKRFAYQAMTTAASLLCVRREELSAPKLALDVAAGQGLAEAAWGRRVALSLRDVSERQPADLEAMLNAKLTGELSIDLTEAPPIQEFQEDHGQADGDAVNRSWEPSGLGWLTLGIFTVLVGVTVYTVSFRQARTPRQ